MTACSPSLICSHSTLLRKPSLWNTPQFQVGEFVWFLLATHRIWGRITEYGGPLATDRPHLYAVQIRQKFAHRARTICSKNRASVETSSKIA